MSQENESIEASQPPVQGDEALRHRPDSGHRLLLSLREADHGGDGVYLVRVGKVLLIVRVRHRLLDDGAEVLLAWSSTG